jgi:hypothetical protein
MASPDGQPIFFQDDTESGGTPLLSPCIATRCGFSALVVNRKITILYLWYFEMGGYFMKKFLIAICSVVLAFGLTGCWGKGKAPVGKGKAPVVQTKG